MTVKQSTQSLTHVLIGSLSLIINHILHSRYDFFSSLIFGPVQTDRQKAMHMSPPCMDTGRLKNAAQAFVSQNIKQFISSSPPLIINGRPLNVSFAQQIHFTTILLIQRKIIN